MPATSWLNSNEYRSYPFLARSQPFDVDLGDDLNALPEEAIVDFGAITGIAADFVEDEHTVYLHSIQRTADTFTYEFRTTAPEAAGTSLIFTRSVDDAEFSVEWTDASVPAGSSQSSASSVAECVDAPLWTGFLVTGRFADLAALIADGETLYFNPQLWVVEPARIQSLSRTFVRSLNLANVDRTRVSIPAECLSESSSSGDAEEAAAIFVNSRCIQGEVVIRPGFNCSLRQEVSTNTLIIGAAVGAGDGEPCEEIPLYEGEVPPDDSPFLTGGPGCSDIIQTINGKGGRRFRLEAGPGFRVQTAEADPHTLIIDADLHDFALCPAGSAG